MRWYASLRWKLTILIAAGSAFTAVLAAAGFTWFDLQRFWQHTRLEITAVGNIVADQVGPAIILGDRNAAQEVLGSLRAAAVLRDAALYDRRGAVFASLRVGANPPERPASDGIYRSADAIVLSQPVMAGGDRIGTLVLRADVPSILEILRQYLGGTAMILLLSLMVAAVTAAALQSKVSAPILKIAGIAERIARTHCFEDRVTINSSDEVGELATSFNTMLREIERRDEELAEHRRRLEQQIAERNRVNAELLVAKDKAESAARLKSEFLANMSHEIRTPMNGILGMTELALATELTPLQADHLHGVKSSAEGLLRIINDILDVSKIEAGKLAIEAVDFDLGTMLQETTRLFEIAVREKQLTLGLHVDPACPACVCGDPVRLRQILINLIGNAVKFTMRGSIDVFVAPTVPGRLRFTVADTGIGIAPEKLEGIFEAFTQADGSHARRFGGTGLGLTITRRLADLMDGRVWVESQASQGSRFHLELALPQRRSRAIEAAPAETVVLEPLHILVAEDNPVNQKVICALLRLAGSSTQIAANGAEAFNFFLRKSFDLILMDIQMPGLDGLDATDLIRQEEHRRQLARTPILALTAHTAAAQHEQCLARGMDGIVTKPVSRSVLLQSIDAIIRQSHASRSASDMALLAAAVVKDETECPAPVAIASTS